ncbi:MAG: hypothetical protein ACTH0E_10240 [Candidatus Microbacterium stercoravium]
MPVERRVFNFPGWHDNPYVQILQSEITRRGYELAGIPDFDRAIAELTSPERRGVIHVQWTSPVTEWAVNAVDARRRTDLFLDALFSAKQWGRAIVWTLHNVLPHDTLYPKTNAYLHARLAELADAIHVLSPHTAELAAPVYALPAEKIVEIPHSSYDGVYGDPVERTAAREAIGVAGTGPAILFFGWIRPYKGLEHLEAATRIATEGGADLQLLLAGRPQGDVAGILDAFENGPVPLTTHLKRILPEDVATWFGAADVLVLPYRAILNSGNMFLAATYSLPIILPDEPHLVDEFGDEAWIRFFDRSDPDASLAALLADDWYRSRSARSAARAFADARPPSRMSAQYADLIERLAGRE